MQSDSHTSFVQKQRCSLHGLANCNRLAGQLCKCVMNGCMSFCGQRRKGLCQLWIDTFPVAGQPLERASSASCLVTVLSCHGIISILSCLVMVLSSHGIISILSWSCLVMTSSASCHVINCVLSECCRHRYLCTLCLLPIVLTTAM